MWMTGALELLSWPLVLARAARAEIGARVDPVARLVARRLGQARPSATVPGEELEAAASDLRPRAEAAKFWLGPAHQGTRPAVAGALLDPEPGELPAAYDGDRIAILPRDPWWIFVYWEITRETRERALGALASGAADAREVLRIYDVTFVHFTGDNAWLSFDVDVPRGATSWYVNVARPAASYCAEVGLKTDGGHFLPLVRSQVVTTPRATPATETDVRWLEFGPTGPARPQVSRAASPATADETAPRPGG